MDDPLTSAPEHYGRYRLVERIGVGGMAEVFKAYVEGCEGFGDAFVIKRIRPEKSDRAEIIQMFCDEARIAALLSHPNIVETYDFGQIGGAYFMTMEYLRGRDLSAVMRASRLRLAAVPPFVAARIAEQVALGLEHAHCATFADGRPAGIIHRDVTPSNIMLLASGGVKVLDFGIAKVAATARAEPAVPRKRRIKGKLAYLSPEQVRNADLDARSDVFSLGVVLWEMLVGQRLFAGGSEFETLRNVLTLPVPPPSSKRPDVPPALDGVVARALERDRDARHASAGALARELGAALAQAQGGRDDVATLLTSLFGDDAARPRERMTASLSGDSISSLEGEAPGRLTGEVPIASGLAPARAEGSRSAPKARRPPSARRHRALAIGAGAALLAALALGVFWRRAFSPAAPDPSRPANTTSAGR